MKGAIYYVAIATVIFSHVKISSFRAKAHLVFHWCLYNKDGLFELVEVEYDLDGSFEPVEAEYDLNGSFEPVEAEYDLDGSFEPVEGEYHLAGLHYLSGLRNTIGMGYLSRLRDMIYRGDIKFSRESSPGISLVFI